MLHSNQEKYRLLKRGVIYDLIGMSTMLVPFAGPFLDIVWAPYAARQMRKMYKGNEGKIASVLVFLEEILPYTDIVPSFTLMWLYTFVWKKQPAAQMLRVEADK